MIRKVQICSSMKHYFDARFSISVTENEICRKMIMKNFVLVKSSISISVFEEIWYLQQEGVGEFMNSIRPCERVESMVVYASAQDTVCLDGLSNGHLTKNCLLRIAIGNSFFLQCVFLPQSGIK